MFSFCLDHGLFGFIFLSVSYPSHPRAPSSFHLVSPSHPRAPSSFHLVSETKRIRPHPPTHSLLAKRRKRRALQRARGVNTKPPGHLSDVSADIFL